ncbi:MAG: aminomethyl transferase family protein [Alphaproteobacteria bacterium]|nr:aminomethyl transferase family protein [Alphaproteobacteria bacterium]MCB9699500.1 aminomethyl transferase family protein [Alphaproteobacteria bacterium]
MPRPTPFHARTSAACHSFLWKEWNGFAAVRAYDGHSEDEYFAVRSRAAVLDVSPLCKLDVSGTDAARLLSRVFSRDVERLPERRTTYGVLIDPKGKVLDDGTVAHLEGGVFRLCANERWGSWLRRNARGLDVSIEDTTERWAALAVQGPASRDVLAGLVDFELPAMPFFRCRAATIAGVRGWVSRTGYTGDLGYEVFVGAADAERVWDAILGAGRTRLVVPMGLDALDVVRIEAGFVLSGVDYHGSRAAMIESRKVTPDDAGLGFCVDLERSTPFCGQSEVVRDRDVGPTWDIVGIELDWAELEGLYHREGLPPHLAPVACRIPVPVYAADGRTQVGQVTSQTWSPILKRYLCLASVRRPHHAIGGRLRIEHTVEYERRTVGGTVVPRTFFDPPRKREVVRKTERTNPPAPRVQEHR